MSELILGRGAFMPERSDYCFDDDFESARFLCFRARGHHGRHALTTVSGRVVAVWGEDVYAHKRHPDVPEWGTRCEHPGVCDTERECDRQALADDRQSRAEEDR